MAVGFLRKRNHTSPAKVLFLDHIFSRSSLEEASRLAQPEDIGGLSQPEKTSGLALSEKTSGSSAEKAPKFFIPGELAARRARYSNQNYRKREERLDRFLTGRITGGLTMLLLLTAVFWLTMTGANYPSALLYDWLFSFEEVLETVAGSVITGHCGRNTLGVLFIAK